MTLGSDIDAALPELRAEAESRMTASSAITRPGDEVVWNPETMQNENVPMTVYTGKCRVRAAGQQDRAENAADQSFMASQYILSLPVVGSEGVRRDDTVTVIGCPEDAALVGDVFRVVAESAGSQMTARRLTVTRTQ